MKILFSLFVFLAIPVYADDLSAAWSLSMSCPESGTSSPAASFSGSTGGGFTGSGTCQRIATRFSKFSFTSSSGGTLNSNTVYGLHTGDLIILPPILSTETKPLFMMTPACPVSNKSLNWITAQWHASENHTLNDYHMIGTGTYSTSTGLAVTNSYDVDGSSLYSGSIALAGSCSNGVYTLTGTGNDRIGNVYFNLNGAGSFKAASTKATLFVPVYTISAATDLGSRTFPGLIFNSTSASVSKAVRVTTDAAGTTWTVDPYSNVETGTIEVTWQDTITISAVNSPANGMMRGSVTRVGAGSGTGEIACVMNKGVATRVVCSGETANNNNLPYSLAFAYEGPHIIGQSNGTSEDQYDKGLGSPDNTWVAGGKMFVADGGHNRVLIWNTVPTSNYAPFDVVIGQPDKYSYTANNGGISAARLNGPTFVYSDGTKMYVADTLNNRVLIWNTIPTVTGTAANLVLGQNNMTSSGANAGGISATSLSDPRKVYIFSSRLYVSDTGNSRVLVWTTIPTTNRAAANLVYGPSAMNTTTQADEGKKLGTPYGIYTNGTKLFISDNNAHKILAWNAVPGTNGPTADYVLGQPDLNSYTLNQNGSPNASTLYIPKGIASDGTKFVVADTDNHRILIWNTLPTATNQAADVVLGQPNMTSSTENNGGRAATTLSFPYDVHTDGTKLYVTDTQNHRILIWNTIPTSNQTAANVVVGQPDMNAGSWNGFPTSTTLNLPWGNAAYCNGKVMQAECGTHRVLIWNSIPRNNGTPADVVLGQPNMYEGDPNYGGSITASTLTCANSVQCDGTRVLVADWDNNRVLIWNTIPTTNGQAADVVVGQPNMTSGTGNNGGMSCSRVNGVAQAYSDGTKLYLADYHNHRVLIYNTIPTSNGACADVVLGQNSMSTGNLNQGGSAAAYTMNHPAHVITSGTKLIVSDTDNGRLMIWNTIPTSNNAAANVFVGQSNGTNAGNNFGGVSGASLCWPEGVTVANNKLIIADDCNNRVLVYNTIPTSNGATADVALGQPNLTSNTANNGGITSRTLNNACGVISDGTRLYVTDCNNHRIVTYDIP
jgi:hypothetical protein